MIPREVVHSDTTSRHAKGLQCHREHRVVRVISTHTLQRSFATRPLAEFWCSIKETKPRYLEMLALQLSTPPSGADLPRALTATGQQMEVRSRRKN